MAYDNHYYRARETWRDWRIEARELMDRARIDAGQRVLEIGCGGGGLLRLISARGAQAIGVDTQASALELAHRRQDSLAGHRLQVLHVGVSSALPFCDGLFDALVAQHLLEHLIDFEQALCEWQRVLRPGGRLALATPNARYPDPTHYSDSDHVRVWASDELREAITHAGFAIDSCTTIFACLAPSWRIGRALGVIGYSVFRRAPYFAARGRTILIGARKPESRLLATRRAAGPGSGLNR